jgi:hypothetical protein
LIMNCNGSSLKVVIRHSLHSSNTWNLNCRRPICRQRGSSRVRTESWWREVRSCLRHRKLKVIHFVIALHTRARKGFQYLLIA